MSIDDYKGKIAYVAYVRQKRLRFMNSATLSMQKATMVKHDSFSQYSVTFMIILKERYSFLIGYPVLKPT